MNASLIDCRYVHKKKMTSKITFCGCNSIDVGICYGHHYRRVCDLKCMFVSNIEFAVRVVILCTYNWEMRKRNSI